MLQLLYLSVFLLYYVRQFFILLPFHCILVALLKTLVLLLQLEYHLLHLDVFMVQALQFLFVVFDLL